MTVGSGVVCPFAMVSGANVTLCAGNDEVQNWLGGTSGSNPERIFAYPTPNIRLAFAPSLNPASTFTTLHRDALKSVRMITNAAGAMVERTVYRRFGRAVAFAKLGLTRRWG